MKDVECFFHVKFSFGVKTLNLSYSCRIMPPRRRVTRANPNPPEEEVVPAATVEIPVEQEIAQNPPILKEDFGRDENLKAILKTL